jgi:hypothetical protein
MTHPTPWQDQPATLMPQDVRLMIVAFRIANSAPLWIAAWMLIGAAAAALFFIFN